MCWHFSCWFWRALNSSLKAGSGHLSLLQGTCHHACSHVGCYIQKYISLCPQMHMCGGYFDPFHLILSMLLSDIYTIRKWMFILKHFFLKSNIFFLSLFISLTYGWWTPACPFTRLAYLPSVHFPQILFQELFPSFPLEKLKGSFRWQR